MAFVFPTNSETSFTEMPPLIPKTLVTKAVFIPSRSCGTLFDMSVTSKFINPMRMPTNVPRTPMVVRRLGAAALKRAKRVERVITPRIAIPVNESIEAQNAELRGSKNAA